MTNDTSKPDFEPLYNDARSADRPIHLDIGGPQPVVRQLVAYGAVRGEVLDPGTGLGHHAIYFASQGYSATGVDSSPSAIELATRNAERAGVSVNFQVADATKLDGFEGRFDTVVDSAFYNVFLDDQHSQTRYLQALHRATKPGARLFMFEFGRHNVNGVQVGGLTADNFERVLPAGGWRLDYLGTSTCVAVFNTETLAVAEKSSPPEVWERMKPLHDQLRVIEPLLEDHRVHLPVWAVTATRLD